MLQSVFNNSKQIKKIYKRILLTAFSISKISFDAKKPKNIQKESDVTGVSPRLI